MIESMAADATFRAEVKGLLGHCYRALVEVLMAPDRTSKHPPYSWTLEEQDEHLRKGVRHVLTYQLARDGQSANTEDDHLHRALVRVLMGLALREIGALDKDYEPPELPEWIRQGNRSPDGLRRRARVYVAGAYNADNVIDVLHNMRRGMETAAFIFSWGMAPFTPWHDYHHLLHQPQGRELGILDFYEMSMSWLDASDAVYLVDPLDHKRTRNSTGTQGEIEHARANQTPIFDDFPSLLEWHDTWRKERDGDARP